MKTSNYGPARNIIPIVDYRFYSTKAREDLFILHYHIKKLVLSGNITVEIMNIAMGKDIITQELIDLCKDLYDKRTTYQLPWSREITSFSEFTKAHGPICSTKSSSRIAGIYILQLPEADNSYVGQSVNLSVRIRSHLHINSTATKFVLQTLKKNRSGRVQTCVISSDVVSVLTTMNIEISDFLNILEQYVILSTCPTLNRIYLIRKGLTISYKQRQIASSTKKTVYIYKILQKSPFKGILIYELPSITSIMNIIGGCVHKNVLYNTLMKSGFYRDTIYCTTTPVENIVTEIITEAQFVAYFKEITVIPFEKSPRSLYIIDTITTTKAGPYPSARYISKYIFIGTRSSSFTPHRKTLYKKRYLFEYADQ